MAEPNGNLNDKIELANRKYQQEKCDVKYAEKEDVKEGKLNRDKEIIEIRKYIDTRASEKEFRTYKRAIWWLVGAFVTLSGVLVEARLELMRVGTLQSTVLDGLSWIKKYLINQ